MKSVAIIVLLCCALACTARVFSLQKRAGLLTSDARRPAHPKQSQRRVQVSGQPEEWMTFFDGFYYLTLDVGQPAQSIDVLVDTGSSNFAVPATFCTNCNAKPFNNDESKTFRWMYYESEACQTCSPYGQPPTTKCLLDRPFPFAQNNTLCGFGITYGGGSSGLEGAIGSDMVQFGQYTVETSVYLISQETPAASFTQGDVVGIVGLASPKNACNPTCVPTIVDSIVSQAQIPNIVSVCLSSEGGTLEFGGVNTSRYSTLWELKGEVDTWYTVRLDDIKVGGYTIGVPNYFYRSTNDVIGTFLDSGTSSILLCPAAFGALQSLFQTKFCNLPKVCGNETIFQPMVTLTAAEVAFFPTLEFSIEATNGSMFPALVPSYTYFMEVQPGQFVLNVQPVVGVGVVLGTPFMVNFYVVHHRNTWTTSLGTNPDCQM